MFEIYILFTREPFVQYFTKELEFYSSNNGRVLGLVSLDLVDKDYYACVLSRDISKQYRAESIKASIPTIKEAREWLDSEIGADSIVFHDNKTSFFNIFESLGNDNKQHPNYVLLRDSDGFSSAKSVLSEISYHYKDIDGNFIEQFQTVNGFDARIWELFLFCFFREQFFSFERNHEAPDFLVEKLGSKIAIEAVIVSRKTAIESYEPKTKEEIDESLSNAMPLMFASALFDKLKKKYWEKQHVQGLPFLIAIADFHDTMSMTWSYNALSEYLYGYKYDHSFVDGILQVHPVEVGNYKKPNGTEIPSGFFFQPNCENVSGVIFSSCATLSKFNRMGKQAGLGSDNNKLIRMGSYYDHDPNAASPRLVTYEVNEFSDETWSEGVIIFHNPNALIKLDPGLFDDRVAHVFFKDKFTHSIMPEVFPYNSFTQNLVITK